MQFVLLQSSADRKEQNWRAVKIFDSKQLWLMLLFTWVFRQVSTRLLKEISVTVTVLHNHTYAWPSTRVMMDTNSITNISETWLDK